MGGDFFWSEGPVGLKLFYVAVGAEVVFALAVALWAGAILGTVSPANYWVVAASTVVAAWLGVTGHRMAHSLGRWGPPIFWGLSFVAAVLGAVNHAHFS
jgi:ABC-type phosphate/phosphonate transport system permease subunit